MELCGFPMWVCWVNRYGKYSETRNGKSVNPWNDNCGITINGSLPISMMEKVKCTCQIHYGFSLMPIPVYSRFSMNGKNSVSPLMDLLMGFVKFPFTFPIMCFWKIFLCLALNQCTTYKMNANKKVGN